MTLEDVEAAAARLQGLAVRTPLLLQPGLLQGPQDVYVKAENLQRTGAFKFRGAFNTLAQMKDSDPGRVITSSSGNHGQAVAAAGQILGIPVTVVMPTNAIQAKVDAVKRYGGRVVFAGTSSLKREAEARRIGDGEGGTVIGSFDDARIIAGQGTAGLEILEHLPETDLILVPVGGGGLISGIAVAAKALRPSVEVIGVEPEGAADARDSLRSGSRVTWDRIDTIADGLRTSSVGRLNFEIIRRLVDDILVVSEDEIQAAMRYLAFSAKLTIEPSGAVAFAAVLAGRLQKIYRTTVVLLSGGNVDPTAYAQIIGTQVTGRS